MSPSPSFILQGQKMREGDEYVWGTLFMFLLTYRGPVNREYLLLYQSYFKDIDSRFIIVVVQCVFVYMYKVSFKGAVAPP
uniref:Uncharacterized protein n=1 Tax=Anguilla anguilla TaxID=7936 RepID=A0A0E9VU50_ANGAN